MYTLRFLEVDDAEQLANYLRRNREFHRQWSPIAPPEFFTIEFQRGRLERTVALREQELEFRFGIFHPGEEELMVGSINLTAIERNAFQNGRLGYSIDARHRNSGVMTKMLRSVMGFAFDYLRLHRLEANVIPRNFASQRVLEKCGFRKIGFSPKMLFINGKWEDHDMFMALAEDFTYQAEPAYGKELQTFIPLVGR